MANTKYIISLVDQVTRTARTIGRSLNGITAQAQKADAAVSGITLLMAGAAVAGVFKLGAELESTKIIFNTLTQSVEKGTALFEGLTKFANETPFSNTALNKNAEMLLAFGETADSVIGTLKVLGDISVGDQERLGRLTLAFAQTQAAGKLMGQDLLQMINAGFNPLQEISKATGKSMGFLKDQMAKGAISADMIRAAFEAAAGPGGRFNGMVELMAESMAGKWSTALGKAKFIIAEFGLSLKGVFLPFLNGIINTIDFMSRFKNIIFPIIGIIGSFVGTILAVVGAMKAWVFITGVLNTVMALNPVMLIVAGIAALITGIVMAWQKFEGFRKVVMGTWYAIKELGRMIKEFATTLKERLINRVMQVLSGFKTLGLALWSFIKGDFKQAGELAKKGFDDLYNISGKIAGAKKAGKRLAAAYKEGAAVGAGMGGKKLALPGMGGGAGDAGSIGLTDAAAKLQAEGVVSGGIKTFNINIAGITGINTLSTTNIQEGATQTARAVTDALLEALSDIKNVG